MGNYVVFIDESGNAGANLIDKEQPFFTLVGMSFSPHEMEAIEKELIELEKYSGLPEGTEIKGSGAIKGDFADYVMPSIDILLSKSSSIFWSVIERRFMIAGIIVDNLYDYVYNDAVSKEWTFPTKKRQDLANHFYNFLSEESLTLAASALVKGDANETRQLIALINKDLENHRVLDGFDVIAALSGATSHVDEMCSVIASVTSRDRNDPLRSGKGTVSSPNFTAFFEMLNRIEDYYRGEADVSVELVFDSSSQYDAAFAHLHQLLVNSEPGELRFPGRPPILGGFRCIKSFQPADSKTHPLLKSADLFAAGVRMVFELFANQSPPPEINKSLTYFLGFIVTNLDTPLYNYVVSDAIWKKIFPTAKKYAP
jgi:hypothetical protein